MAEWLTLLLLIPAIMVPVALLVGFAGCDRVFGLTDVPIMSAMIDSATGKDGTTITLIWHSVGIRKATSSSEPTPTAILQILMRPPPPPHSTTPASPREPAIGIGCA
jgi:hypothetical protein